MLTFESEFELEVVAIKKIKVITVYFIKIANSRNSKKLGNATIRNQKQNERKKALRNVIKISTTISKLKNEKKIKKKLLSKAKKATEKRFKKIRLHGFKTDSILRQIIEDVITDVYEIPFKEFGKTRERIHLNYYTILQNLIILRFIIAK